MSARKEQTQRRTRARGAPNRHSGCALTKAVPAALVLKATWLGLAVSRKQPPGRETCVSLLPYVFPTAAAAAWHVAAVVILEYPAGQALVFAGPRTYSAAHACACAHVHSAEAEPKQYLVSTHLPAEHPVSTHLFAEYPREYPPAR